MDAGSSSFRILLAPIGGGTNDETNDALDNFCSDSYAARQFRLASERVDVPLGPGRLRTGARARPSTTAPRRSRREQSRERKRERRKPKKRWRDRSSRHSFRFTSLNTMVRSSLPVESSTRTSHVRKHARVSA